MTSPGYLADENVPIATVRAGFNIVAVSDVQPGATDKDVLALAIRENRIVISFDKDLGRLVFVERLVPAGVVLLRIPPRSQEYISGVLQNLLRSGISLVGRFAVVSEDRVRSVPLPAHQP